jgi:chromatin segregation and condensation protein Rec8/ScpA/Scc1 (kleisin family)
MESELLLIPCPEIQDRINACARVFFLMQGAMEQLTELIEMGGKKHYEIYAEAAEKLCERRKLRRRQASRKKLSKTRGVSAKVPDVRSARRFSARLAAAARVVESEKNPLVIENAKSLVSIKSFTTESDSEMAKMVNRWEF